MKGPFYNGLRVQIVLFLTLALLPLGSIAIYQTNRVAAEAERNAELALLALTGRAAKQEELVIERAFGTARFLATIVPEFINDPDRCARDLGEFVASNRTYSFIGILPISGFMTCSSSGVPYDFSEYPNFSKAIAAQERTITVNRAAPLSGESVFIISEPFEIDGNFAGFISISVPHRLLPDDIDELAALGLQELLTVNRDGDILRARGDFADAARELPVEEEFDIRSDSDGRAFQARNQEGRTRIYSVVPIQGSPAVVVGVWRITDGVGSQIGDLVRPAIFPVLMWFASMAVAMLSLHTLVLRHVIRLRSDMETFADTRVTKSRWSAGRMPNELQALFRNFEQMTDDILRDEADLEDAIRAKKMLIKEVHHRVKNNLQLISSIMNMQIRTAEHDETRSVLARLQDRVLSLATIHRDLYQSQNGGMVNVGTLVTEVVQKSLELATEGDADVDVTTDIDPVLLYPDQAVPLSLMMAEAMTNALKYLGAADGVKPWIRVSLKQEDDRCILTLANSVGPVATAESTGLGTQLINAFAIQLGAKIDTDQDADSYVMRVGFKVQEFIPETRDF